MVPQLVRERKDEMTLKWVHRLRIMLWKGLWAHTGGCVFSVAGDKESSQSTKEKVNKRLPHSGGGGGRIDWHVLPVMQKPLNRAGKIAQWVKSFLEDLSSDSQNPNKS